MQAAENDRYNLQLLVIIYRLQRFYSRICKLRGKDPFADDQRIFIVKVTQNILH